MEPITTAIATAVATGLAEDAIKSGYEKLKTLIIGTASAEKKTEREQAIAALEKSKAEVECLVSASGVSQNAEVLKQAVELMKTAGDHITMTGNQNATALHGGKAVVIAGNAGDVNL